MTRAIENPVTGGRIEFRERTADTLQFDYYLAPDGFAVGRFDHVHPKQEERFEIVSGQLGVRIDGDEWTATAGTRFAIPPETAHTVWNDGEEVLHAVVEIRPALDLESFFETMYGLACEGKTNGWGLPGPLQLAMIVDEHRDEIYLAGVPRRLQQGVATAVRPIARAAGYRANYPRYSESVTPRP